MRWLNEPCTWFRCGAGKGASIRQVSWPNGLATAWHLRPAVRHENISQNPLSGRTYDSPCLKQSILQWSTWTVCMFWVGVSAFCGGYRTHLRLLRMSYSRQPVDCARHGDGSDHSANMASIDDCHPRNHPGHGVVLRCLCCHTIIIHLLLDLSPSHSSKITVKTLIIFYCINV